MNETTRGGAKLRSTGTQEDPKGVVWFLRTTALFQDMTESVVNWAGEESCAEEYGRGEVIRLGTGSHRRIFVVAEGQVKLRATTEAGKERIIDVAGPGDTFGELDWLVEHKNRIPTTSSEGMAAEAVAMTKAVVLKFDVGQFQRMIERRPMIVLNVSRILGLKQRRLEVRLARLLYRSSMGKVAGVLAELAERYGVRTEKGIELNFKLTHQELASLIGAKRETVSESLATLELDGLISFRRNQMTIHRLEELDRIP